jgi:hypothetical protein
MPAKVLVFLIFSVLFSLNSSASGTPTYGSCAILQPGSKDASQNSCDTGYTFTYNGYMAEIGCYRRYTTAVSLTYLTNACELPDRVGNCSILYPGMKDDTGDLCKFAYAVKCNGKILDSCQSNLTEAMAVLLEPR